MEDDDGLLLNFAIPDNSTVKHSNQTSKVSGGKWKDRRKLQLSLQGRGRNVRKSNGAASGVNNSKIISSRLDKSTENKEKPQDNHKVIESHKESQAPPLKKTKFSESKGEFGGKNNSYVSSLFTSNKSSTLKTKPEVKEVTYLASNAPLKDATSFGGLGLNDKLVNHLETTLRFKHPTSVQKAVLPSMLTVERDLFIKSQTGSGKTLAFVLPIIHKLMMENKHKITRESGLFAIILTPTRELATQIYGVLESINRCCHTIVPGIVIGGEKKKSEKARIRKGVNILVATPGRLADHFENTTSLDISQLRWLILDEGDKLVELGFQETITQITDKITKSSKIMDTLNKWQGLPSKRINILCSATIQDTVKELGKVVLHNPELINLENKNIATDFTTDSHALTTAPDQLIQNILVVPPKLRLVALAAMLKKSTMEVGEGSNRTIVFFSCSDSVNFHFDIFTRNGTNPNSKHKHKDEDGDNEEDIEEVDTSISTSPLIAKSTMIYKLHGSMTQQLRTTTLNAFLKDTSHKHTILFCTDVASRGLDMPNISNVIEFDPPFTVDDHLHRIGRSARVGNKGKAALFLLPGTEEGYVDGKLQVVHPKEGSLKIISYENVLKDGFAEVEEEEEVEYQDKRSKKVDPKHKQGKWDIHATTWHLEVERWLLEDSSAHERAVQAFTSHIRAYATHLSSERNFFNVKLLHLGHLAKSFGLRETPKKLGKSVGSNTGIQEGSKKVKKEDPRKKMLRIARLAVKSSSSEFNY
ncbi:ATP-dependent RNA helicase DBP7 [Scheffersomyces amazonensis]|uniref:ATP-dependent RNA helicase DBP7 n=1 Tax=Scheffersomyces amazonensis TaxID=1078765 RepID=UPI00315D289D